MKNSPGDRKDDRDKPPEKDKRKPYQAPAWEEEKVLEKTALACPKNPGHGCIPPTAS